MLAPLDLVSAETGSKRKGNGANLGFEAKLRGRGQRAAQQIQTRRVRRHLASSSLTRQAALKLFDVVVLPGHSDATFRNDPKLPRRDPTRGGSFPCFFQSHAFQASQLAVNCILARTRPKSQSV